MDETLIDILRARLEIVQEQITLAAQSASRNPANTRLVVVTKMHPVEKIHAVIEAGARVLGENYAEEATAKINALTTTSVEWHMIGHVQSRKASLIAGHFDLMHTLDSLKLATRLDRFSAEAGRILPVLLEVNVSGEGSKFGYPAWDESQWPRLVDEILPLCALPNLQICGLMSMPPFADQAEESRPYFARLRRLQAYLFKVVQVARWDELSMGTSVDYSVAVQEGATLVRVGTAIMGERLARA